MITNPWLELLDSGRLVHSLDEAVVASHNESVNFEHKFLTDMVPEPYVGNVLAPVLLLMSNPGATLANAQGIFSESNDAVVQASLDNLLQRKVTHPLFHLDPKFNGTEGSDWYRAKLKWLIDACGDLKVANNLFTAELVPYHSIKWREPKSAIPTQAYTVSLIHDAMSRGAYILIARSYKKWLKQVPQLANYSRMMRANSPMNASVSPGNYGDENFHQILDALNSK